MCHSPLRLDPVLLVDGLPTQSSIRCIMYTRVEIIQLLLVRTHSQQLLVLAALVEGVDYVVPGGGHSGGGPKVVVYWVYGCSLCVLWGVFGIVWGWRGGGIGENGACINADRD